MSDLCSHTGGASRELDSKREGGEESGVGLSCLSLSLNV